jgi:hypothetical protein
MMAPLSKKAKRLIARMTGVHSFSLHTWSFFLL